MAAIPWHATSGAIALAAASTNKVFMTIQALDANHRTKITSVGVSFNGVTVGDTPCLFKITKGTTNGTTPAAGTSVVSHRSTLDAPAVRSVISASWATPPAAGTVIEEFYVHPQTGFKQFYPLGQELILDFSGTTTLGFEITTGAVITGTVNATVEVDFEE